MDKAFFSDQVRQRERSLYRIAYNYLHNDEDAADALQDALLCAWEKRHTLRQQEYFGTWLTRILINCCKQMLRARKNTSALSEHTPGKPENKTERLALRIALSSLDLKYRIPLFLFHEDGFSIAEISRILLLPQGTVKSRLSRGRSILKDLLIDEEVITHA